MCIPENATLEDIAIWLRNRYPDAASVKVFVNHGMCDVDVSYKTLREGEPVSMRSLDGQWVTKLPA